MAYPSPQTGNRMMELRRNQQARQDEQSRLSQEPHFGAAKSGFMGERDYLNALNEDAELENLDSQAGGRGPARSFGFYPAQGFRSARPGLGALSLGGGAGEEDPYDKSIRQGLATQEYQRGRASMDEYASDKFDRAVQANRPSPSQALDLGYTADAAGKVGDIERNEGLRNARAGAEAFMDPTITRARTTANSEQEQLLESRYGRQADAEAKIESARIAAGGKTGAAAITQAGGLNREAIRGLLKSRELQALTGGKPLDPAQQQQVEDLLWREANRGTPSPDNLPATQGVDDASFQALVAGAADNGPGADHLASYWEQLTPQQQAIARQRLGGRQ